MDATRETLLHLIERPTLAWVERLQRQGREVNAPRVAALVVAVLCRQVSDARAHRDALVGDLTRFVGEILATSQSG